MREQTFFKPLLITVSGLLIWAAHFTVIYAINALACERDWAYERLLGMGYVPFLVLTATLAASVSLAVIGILALLGRAPDLPDVSGARVSAFLRKVTISVVGLSLLAVIYETIPAFMVPACG